MNFLSQGLSARRCSSSFLLGNRLNCIATDSFLWILFRVHSYRLSLMSGLYFCGLIIPAKMLMLWCWGREEVFVIILTWVSWVTQHFHTLSTLLWIMALLACFHTGNIFMCILFRTKIKVQCVGWRGPFISSSSVSPRQNQFFPALDKDYAFIFQVISKEFFLHFFDACGL